MKKRVLIAVAATLIVLFAAAWPSLVALAETGTIHVGATHNDLPGVDQH